MGVLVQDIQVTLYHGSAGLPNNVLILQRMYTGTVIIQKIVHLTILVFQDSLHASVSTRHIAGITICLTTAIFEVDVLI